MGRHSTRQRTRRAARPLVVALAVGAGTVGTGALVLFPTSRATAPAGAPDRSDTPPTVTLAVGGAVSFGGRTLPLLEDPAGPFAGTVDVLRAADVALVDLVAPDDGTTPPPAALSALAEAGVDGVGRLDPRWSGPASVGTTAALSAAGLGHGSTWHARTGPVAVSVLSTSAGVADRADLLAGVARADRAGDVVVVQVDAAPDLTAAVVAAGADVVVGAAPTGGPGSWADDDRRSWVLPTPGPLLVASDAGPHDSALVVLEVSADGVQHAEIHPLEIDAFGRAQPRPVASSGAAPCTPTTSR